MAEIDRRPTAPPQTVSVWCMKHLESVRIEMSFLVDVGIVPFGPKSARTHLESIRSELDRRILSRLRLAISASRWAELELLLGEGADGVAEQFLDRHVPDHRKIAEAELAKLAAEISARTAIERALADTPPYVYDAFARLDAAAASRNRGREFD